MSELSVSVASVRPMFNIVGIGASAGGVDALLRFFTAMPSNSGMAFLIVLHLAPKHESNLAALLQRATAMPVSQVSERVAVEPNHVYVIPPSQNLLMRDGELIPETLLPQRGRATTIDVFFRTLADVHTERSIGIILSGAGSDGAVGITRIKEAGGITIVQEPTDAEYDSMPRCAIETGAIDMVLPVPEIPRRLMEVASNLVNIRLSDGEAFAENEKNAVPSDSIGNAEKSLALIMDLLRVRTGHDFLHYKKATVLRRVERRMQVNCVPSLKTYLTYLSEHHEETPLLLQDMLISVTNFFRDHEAFEMLEQDIIPKLFSEGEAGAPIRAWSVGCATGEEAYSVAMLLIQQRDRLNLTADVQVFATDIDDRAINTARRAIYPDSICTDVTPERLRRFFSRESGHYQIKKRLRGCILFASHNILRDPPFSRVNLISCRNLLIYLNRDVQEKVLEMFHFALTPGGYLFLGSSESAEIASRLFIPVDKKNRIYRASTLTRSSHYSPPLPSGQIPSITPAYAGGEPRLRMPYADLHQRLLEHYAPPSVLANHEGEIVHLSEKAGRYLRYVGGEPSHGLLALVIAELRPELRTAFFQVTQNAVDVETRQVPVERDGQKYYVSLTLRPIRHDNIPGDFVLVLFNESQNSHVAELPKEGETSFIARQLENELFMTKGQLQLTIEQYETSAEELKASNEELQAINEELRSATEELKTSKEELESINEELVTVNHQLKLKVDETSKSNDDLQNFIASTEIATIFVDRTMCIKRYTPRAGRIFKLIASDIDRPLLDIAHCLDYPLLASDAAEVFHTLNKSEREVTSADGSRYIVRLVPYRTNEGLISGLVLTFIDITGLHVVQHKLAEEERRMRVVAASTRDYAIVTVDLQGIVTYWNSGAERIFGYREDEVIGRSLDLIYTPEDIERNVFATELDTARRESRAVDERWHVRKDGTRLFCSGIVTRLDDSEIKGYVKIARDLTEVKESESRRDAALERETTNRRQVDAARRSRDDFLVALSHELKSPLNLIQLNAQLLRRIPQVRDIAQVARVTDTIRAAVANQTRTLDNLLDLTTSQTAAPMLNKTVVDLVSLMQQVIQSFSAEIANKALTVRCEASDSALMAVADNVRLEQVIWNLLDNAIKFTPVGGSVTVTLFERDGMAGLRVADSGSGIAPHLLPHVFNMVEKPDLLHKREGSGLGIGLALVRRWLEGHGGGITAASEGVGKGATFVATIPMFDRVADIGIPRLSEDEFEFLRGLRVLLLDRNPADLQALAELLASHGVIATGAGQIVDALRHTEKSGFDLIVVSLTAAGEEEQFINTLRHQSHGALAPVVALTDLGRLMEPGTVLERGFSAQLRKPMSLEAFAAMTRSLLKL